MTQIDEQLAPKDDSSGGQMSNEVRAYTLLIKTLEDSNRTQTTTDRWVISVLALVACITSINLALAWQTNASLTSTKGQGINQSINQQIGHQDGLLERLSQEALRNQQNGNMRGTGQSEGSKANGPVISKQ